jgi:hypothetical protein
VPLSVVNFVTGGTTASVTSITTGTFTSVAGNLIVVGLRINASDMTAVSSITDTAGNSYTPLTGTLAGAAGAVTQLWYAKNVIGNASNVVTAAFSSSQANTGICAWHISGADASNPADQVAFATGNSNTITSSAYTTTSANEIICAICEISAINTVFTQQATYTLDSAGFPTPAGMQFCGAEHLIVNALQTGVTTSMSGSNTAVITISVATFKQSTVVVTPYSVPDCRTAKPNAATSRTVNATKIYDVQTSSNPAIPPTDSRAAGAPVASGTYPQNSRTPGTFGPGQ